MDESIVTMHTSAWAWYIVAVVFFNTLLIFIALRLYIWVIITLVPFITSIYFAYKRKFEVEKIK